MQCSARSPFPAGVPVDRSVRTLSLCITSLPLGLSSSSTTAQTALTAVQPATTACLTAVPLELSPRRYPTPCGDACPAPVQRPCACLCHPCALGRRLTPEASRGALGADRRARLSWRGDASRQELACFSQETYLPLLFVHIDANICHGWSPLCSMDCVMVCGA
jgi:hypothetical protein